MPFPVHSSVGLAVHRANYDIKRKDINQKETPLNERGFLLPEIHTLHLYSVDLQPNPTFIGPDLHRAAPY